MDERRPLGIRLNEAEQYFAEPSVTPHRHKLRTLAGTLLSGAEPEARADKFQ